MWFMRMCCDARALDRGTTKHLADPRRHGHSARAHTVLVTDDAPPWTQPQYSWHAVHMARPHLDFCCASSAGFAAFFLATISISLFS